MTRTLMIAMLSAVLCAGVAAAAHPQGIGFGLMAGEPTGFSAKIWTGRHIALDAGLGYSYWWYGQALQVHGDVLFHSRNLLQPADGYLPLYIGVGARVKMANSEGKHDYPMRVGLRIPFGLEYVLARVPVGLFFELVPIFDFAPAANFGYFNSAVGFRYYFSGLSGD